MSSLVEMPIKKEDSSSDEDRSGSGVEDALFCFKKFSLRLLLQRLELGLIRFFHRSGAWVILVPWMSIVPEVEFVNAVSVGGSVKFLPTM